MQQRRDALACVRAGPDLVMLDIMLPVMDGWEVCRALCDDPALSSIHGGGAVSAAARRRGP